MINCSLSLLSRSVYKFGEVPSASDVADQSESPRDTALANLHNGVHLATAALKEGVENFIWKQREVKPGQNILYFKADGKSFRQDGAIGSRERFYYDTESFSTAAGDYYEINRNEGKPQNPALYARKDDVDQMSKDY